MISNLASRLSGKKFSIIAQRYNSSFKDIFQKSIADSVETEQDSATYKNSLIEKNLATASGDLSKLRRFKAYNPEKSNIHTEIKQLTKRIFGTEYNEASYESLKLDDPLNKYKLLTGCISSFGHTISNTALNEIKTVEDLIRFYLTEVKDSSPLEDLKSHPDLPPNVHVNLEYKRFDPVTDNFFGAKDAYPKRDTIVSSLWYSKKYKSVLKKKELFSK